MTELQSIADCCPRCGDSFHCGVNDAAPCACTTLHLDDRTLVALRRDFTGCLCLRCLQACACSISAESAESARSDEAGRTG